MLHAFRGQLAESEWYPAQDVGVSARRVPMPGGEHVRVVEAGDPAHDPVVLLHGWGCSAYFFRHLVHPLVEAGFRTVALDLRGHGGSSRPRDPAAYTGPAMLAFVRAALAALGVGPAHVIGHSLGGGLSIDLAAADPDQVRTLTLLAPVGLAPVRFVRIARLATPPLAAFLVPYAVPRWSIPLVLRAVWGREGRWASRDVDEYWAPTADPAFALALRDLLHHFRFAPRPDEELGRVRAETLVILGERDLLVRSAASARRARGRDGWTTVTLAGAGHVLAEEAPDAVLAHLLPHLARRGKG